MNNTVKKRQLKEKGFFTAVAESVLSQLKHRQVKHFGYEFEYGTNIVDPDKPIPSIPQNYKFLQTLFDKHGYKYTYDQLTINKYLSGQGNISISS